jgi:hypothetical protein
LSRQDGGGGTEGPTEMLCSVAADLVVEVAFGGRIDTLETVGYNNASLARKSILVGITSIYLSRFEDSSCTFDTISETLDFEGRG